MKRCLCCGVEIVQSSNVEKSLSVLKHERERGRKIIEAEAGKIAQLERENKRGTEVRLKALKQRHERNKEILAKSEPVWAEKIERLEKVEAGMGETALVRLPVEPGTWTLRIGRDQRSWEYCQGCRVAVSRAIQAILDDRHGQAMPGKTETEENGEGEADG